MQWEWIMCTKINGEEKKKFPGIYSLLAELYNLYPKWNIKPLKSKSNKAAKWNHSRKLLLNWEKFELFVHITAAAQNLKIHLYSIYSFQFIC